MSGVKNASPMPHVFPKESWVASAALAAAGAYTRSSVIRVSHVRRLTVMGEISAAAIGNVVSVIPLVAMEEGQPPANDATPSVWWPMSVWDGQVTAGTPTAASLPANTDFTETPDFARTLFRQMEIRSEPADAATDEIRLIVSLDVTAAIWAQILYAEAGVVGTPATFAAFYSLSV